MGPRASMDHAFGLGVGSGGQRANDMSNYNDYHLRQASYTHAPTVTTAEMS